MHLHVYIVNLKMDQFKNLKYFIVALELYPHSLSDIY